MSGIVIFFNFGVDVIVNRVWVYGVFLRIGFLVYLNYGGVIDWLLVIFKVDVSNFGNLIF